MDGRRREARLRQKKRVPPVRLRRPLLGLGGPDRHRGLRAHARRCAQGAPADVWNLRVLLRPAGNVTQSDLVALAVHDLTGRSDVTRLFVALSGFPSVQGPNPLPHRGRGRSAQRTPQVDPLLRERHFPHLLGRPQRVRPETLGVQDRE